MTSFQFKPCNCTGKSVVISTSSKHRVTSHRVHLPTSSDRYQILEALIPMKVHPSPRDRKFTDHKNNSVRKALGKVPQRREITFFFGTLCWWIAFFDGCYKLGTTTVVKRFHLPIRTNERGRLWRCAAVSLSVWWRRPRWVRVKSRSLWLRVRVPFNGFDPFGVQGKKRQPNEW